MLITVNWSRLFFTKHLKLYLHGILLDVKDESRENCGESCTIQGKASRLCITWTTGKLHSVHIHGPVSVCLSPSGCYEHSFSSFIDGLLFLHTIFYSPRSQGYNMNKTKFSPSWSLYCGGIKILDYHTCLTSPVISCLRDFLVITFHCFSNVRPFKYEDHTESSSVDSILSNLTI